MALVQGVDAQRRVEADGLAGGAHLALRRRHRHLAERGETRLERAKPWRVDAVIVGDQNALRCHNSLRHYHTLARGRKGRGDRRASETNVRAGFSVNSNRGLMLCVCHTERSEVSLLGTENVDKGFFAEFTLSPFARLRAVRSGTANGLRMTTREASSSAC